MGFFFGLYELEGRPVWLFEGANESCMIKTGRYKNKILQILFGK